MSLNDITWLTTNELENYIHKFANDKTKAAFLGTFPMDHLPKQIPHLPLLFIINTNSSNLPGQHWKAIYVSENKEGEVFDSLAMPVCLQLQQWMNKFTRKWKVSTLILQNPLSPSCGAYVLYFIMTRLNFDTLNACIARFSDNLLKNEDTVRLSLKNIK